MSDLPAAQLNTDACMCVV